MNARSYFPGPGPKHSKCLHAIPFSYSGNHDCACNWRWDTVYILLTSSCIIATADNRNTPSVSILRFMYVSPKNRRFLQILNSLFAEGHFHIMCERVAYLSERLAVSVFWIADETE